jgi:hypothetical protein
MLALQLIGQGAFIVASLALGAKLLALHRRTGETPELAIGLSFLLGGGLGYLSWFALAVLALRGADPLVVHRVALFGLACTCVGAAWNGVGTAAIFRPGRGWPRLYVGAIALGMAGGWVALALAEPGGDGMQFWVGIVLAAFIYGWGALESALLSRVLHKRARLGMADPLVVNRTAQWGLASLAIVMMIVISFTARLVYGLTSPEWVAALSAFIGVVAATSIWLGFFPPRAIRDRLARAYAS